MSSYPFLIAEATLLLLTVVLMIEYTIRRRQVGRDLEKTRQKQQQLTAFASELKNLKGKLARKSEIVDQFPQITKKLTENYPPDAYPSIAVRSAKEFFRAGKSGYFVPVEGSSDYTLAVGVGFPQEWAGKVRIHSDEGILGAALQKRVVVSKIDPLSSSGRRPSRRSLEELGVSPDFVAPIGGISGLVGALVVEGCPFPLEEERINMTMLADLLSMALQNAALLDPGRDGKWVDPLTGVSNRIHFLQRLEQEIRRTCNYRQSMALLMVDIDEFKVINDTYGHFAGDVVIRSMAEIVRKNTRGYDLVGRYGGDEFMVLITSTTGEQAASFADHLREMISTADIAIPGTDVPVRITISGGLAIFPTHGQSTTELFQAADAALYESKRQGRNRIQVATSVRLDGGIATGADADRDTPASTERPTVTGPHAAEYPLGELGGNLGG